MTPSAPSLAPIQLPLRTPRLELRLPSSRDVPDLKRSFRDPRTARASGAYLHSALERREPLRMVVRTRSEFRRAKHLSLSVIHRASGRCIGRVGLRELDWTWMTVGSLAYWIDPAYWGQGLATEASRALCEAAFLGLGTRRISSQALAPNLASQHVLRKLGFKEEGRQRAAIVVHGQELDMILYGLLARELAPLSLGSVAGSKTLTA